MPTPAPARVEAMRKLAFLEGAWSGEGWFQVGGRKVAVRCSETVRSKFDGLVLVVEGRHTAGPAGSERVVHDALGVLTAGDDGAGYAFSTWLANGRGGNHKGEWKDGAFVWGMENPVQGKVRYTIRLDGQGRWHETGESSPDGGATWTPFFEMTLSRAK
ncbi:MAG TPA: hypothetical protein VFO85_05865, partial [Vicinamibacteria bacterium]|nr:hypothetical protein [Vicinamibacteria bacterium]